jgi:hypothetical protein
MEWEERSKQDYYLAAIVAEIRSFKEGFAKNPKSVDIRDCLLRFNQGDTDAPQTVPPAEIDRSMRSLKDEDSKSTRQVEPTNGTQKPNPKEYEMGPELMKDPKWAMVNATAKHVWMERLKPPDKPDEDDPLNKGHLGPK